MAAERNVVNTLDPVRSNMTELNTVCCDVSGDRIHHSYIIDVNINIMVMLSVDVN